MKYSFTNKTAQIQEILFVDGSAIKVLPGEVVEVDSKSVFKHEKERCNKFFKIEEKVEQKKTYKRYSEPVLEIKEEPDGGIE